MGKPKSLLEKIAGLVASGESNCCAECGAFHGWHHPDCSKVTVEELRILLQSARKREERNTTAWKRQREKVAFWQGKYAVLRHENNKLRRANNRLSSAVAEYCARVEGCKFKFNDPELPKESGEPCDLGHDNPNLRSL